jgi:threonine dehydrogenase-like Zn-dependent dehydrogenase
MGKELTIVGAHDVGSSREAEFKAGRIFRLFFNLVESKRFPLSGLISHEFEPKKCQEDYRLLCEKRGETMGVMFDWTKSL